MGSENEGKMLNHLSRVKRRNRGISAWGPSTREGREGLWTTNEKRMRGIGTGGTFVKPAGRNEAGGPASGLAGTWGGAPAGSLLGQNTL